MAIRVGVPPALRMVLLCVLIVGGAILLQTTRLGEDVERAARAIVRLGTQPGAMLAFVGLYSVAASIGVPGTLLTVLGGTAFGLWPGVPLSLLGALLAAALCFAIARGLGREYVERRFGRAAAKLSGLERSGSAFLTFFRLRLIPFLPFAVINFAAGLTPARLGPFLLGTLVGILPSTFAWSYFAVVVGEGSAADRREAALRLGLALSVLFLLSLLPTLVTRFKALVSSGRHEP
jgi:uncharacterized membrane protein YdjX (TVP38/TMEM64 family)